MDQLKQFLSVAAKHQFWIVTGLCVVLGIAGFFMASSTIGDLYSTQETSLNTAFSNVQKVQTALSTHPNSISEGHMNGIIGALREDVRKAWKMQYDRQAKFLIWPEEIKKTSMVLVNRLEGYRPVELKLNYPDEPSNISKGLKDVYARYFDDQMPKLADIIGVKWKGVASDSSSSGGMYGGMGMGGGYGGEGGGEGGGYGGEGGGEGMYSGMGMGMGGAAAPAAKLDADLVTWPESSQNELLSAMRLWSGKTPTVYEILYTQENMWILEGLLRIIAATNGNAKANFQCVIKEIEFIRFGKSAMGKAGTISGAGGGGGGMYAGSMGGYAGEGAGAGYAGEGGGYGGEGEGGYAGNDMYGGQMGGYGGEDGYGDEGASGPDPANNRYVDANFTAVSGDVLRESMGEGDPENAYFAVAKRVPVRMRFKIDQRRVQEFLAKCGSADLVLEVRQWRLGETDAASGPGGGGGMYGGGGGAGAPGLGGMGLGGEGGDEGYGSGMYGGGAAAESASLGRASFDLDMEVYGIVYLFNPVDISKLGLDEVTADTEFKDTVAPEDEAVTGGAPAVDPQGDGNPANDAAGDPGTQDPNGGQATPAAGDDQTAPADGDTTAPAGSAPADSGAPADAADTTAPPAGG